MKKSFTSYSIVLAVAVCSVLFASPQTDYSFVREFGEEGEISDTNKFWKISGISVDRFGNVFVSDLYNTALPPYDIYGWQCVKRWSVNGVFEHFWRSSEYGFQAGIDCRCDGDPVYCTGLDEGWGERLEHTNPDGAVYERFPPDVWNYGNEYLFLDVAASADGSVYGIVNRAFRKVGGGIDWRPQVVKFLWTGSEWTNTITKFVTNEFGFSGSPNGIDADPWQQKIYVTLVASNGNAGVKVYDLDLNQINTLALWSYGAYPLGIAVDNRNGAFFVCEAVSNVIQKFDKSGTQVTSWGGQGSGESEFDRPTDLDIDMNGYVYVADADNHRVQVFAPPQEGNLNFIVYKSKTIVKWKQKAKGKDRDVIMAKGMVAVDTLTNIFGGPGSHALEGLPISLWYGEIPVISNMMPTKSNNKGSRALYKPDKEHKVKLIYKEKGALIKFTAKLKKGDVDGPLGINDSATLPPWLWVNAQMTLSTNYLGVHYMRLEHKNKVGKVYKATKK